MPNDTSRRAGLVCGAGYISGKEVMALELAHGLQEIGWNVHVATTRWGDGELSRRLRGLQIPECRMWLGFISATARLNEIRMTFDQLVHIPSLYSTYREFLREHAPSTVVHTNWQHVLLLLPFLRPERDLLWVHEMMPNKFSYQKMFGRFARRLGRFVAVSNAVGKSIVDLGVRPEKVTVIHNGIVPFQIAKRSPDSSKVRIGIIGQVGEWKGHEDLIEAFADIAEKYPQSELHIFGEASSPYADSLRALIARLNLSGRVVWHGFESDRSKIYSKIDVCVVPSRFAEPFGLVAIEAAMAGLPCVATRRGGLPEIIKDQVTGFIVEERNPKQLSEALIKLIADYELRNGMGIAGQALVSERFTRDRFLKEFADLLEK